MKNLYLMFLSLAIVFSACNSGDNSSKKGKKDSQEKGVVETTVDSLMLQKHRIDSLASCGVLMHKDNYSLGKLKSVTFSVCSVQYGTDTLNYINLKKDCGNEYYYSWENAELLYEECDAFVKAIDKVKENLKRSVDHEEEYFYATKDDIALVANNTGSKWDVRVSIDLYKSNSSISLSEEDLDNLKQLVLNGKKKIEELKK